MTITVLQKERLDDLRENLAYSEDDADNFAHRFGFPVMVSTLASFRPNNASTGEFVINKPTLRDNIKKILQDTSGEPALIVRIADNESRIWDIVQKAKTHNEEIFPMTFFPLGLKDGNLPGVSQPKTQLVCFNYAQVATVFGEALRNSPAKQVFILSNAEPFDRVGLA